MSIEATSWALYKAPVRNSTQVLILCVLADHAHKDGTAAWPRVVTIAEAARCHRATVHRNLRDLEQRGLIRRGDQELVSHLRGDHRPVVWDLNLGNDPSWGTGSQSATSHGVALDASRGRTECSTGSHRATSFPINRTTHEPPMNPPSSPPAGDGCLLGGESLPAVVSPGAGRGGGEVVEPAGSGAYPPAFEQWWSAYPLKKGKKAAFKAWKVATSGSSPDVDKKRLQALTERFRDYWQQLPPDRQRYTKHPATWLNAGSWDDELDETPTTSTNPFLAKLQQGDT